MTETQVEQLGFDMVKSYSPPDVFKKGLFKLNLLMKMKPIN